MKFFVILSTLTTLATASFLRDEIIDSQDDGIISTDSDMGKQMILSKPWDWRSILAYKLGLQHMTPNILYNEEPSGLNRIPWWTCKDSTCLHRRRHTRTPRLVDGTTSGSPNLHEMDKMSLMPRWMCADPTCLHHMMLERTPIMTNTLHWSPKTLEMHKRMNHMTPQMMQTMHRSPMMSMFMKPTMVDESMTPMMRMDMTPIDNWHMGSSMRMTEDLPLGDMTMMNTSPKTLEMHARMNHMASPMMQTMHRSPMMPMFMKPSMVDESMTPMMRMDMTPIDMWHMGSSMRTAEDLPLGDMTIMNTGMQPETNFRNMYMNHMNTLQHQMNMPRMTDARYITHTV